MNHLLRTLKTVPRAALILGLVSFANDVSSEMLYPIMPIFLTSVIHTPVFVVGIIEGIAEGSAALFKLLFGYYSDKSGQRKPYAFAGYALSTLAKAIIAFSYAWPQVLFGRVTDRLGKGVRTGARDALLLDAAGQNNVGLVFGVHRAMDSMGAVVGPLIALALLAAFNDNLRTILLVAIIPGIASLFLFKYVREAKTVARTTKSNLRLSLAGLPRQAKWFIAAVTVFSLGNSSDAFLILRAQSLGMSVTLIVLAYVVYNITYALLSTPAGIVSDRIGARPVYLTGLFIFAGVYLGFAMAPSSWLVWPLFMIYGAYIAFTDGVSKAYLGSLVDKSVAGTAYGTLQGLGSLATLFASIIGGVLWTLAGPAATFGFGTVMALIAIALLTTTAYSSPQNSR